MITLKSASKLAVQQYVNIFNVVAHYRQTSIFTYAHMRTFQKFTKQTGIKVREKNPKGTLKKKINSFIIRGLMLITAERVWVSDNVTHNGYKTIYSIMEVKPFFF